MHAFYSDRSGVVKYRVGFGDAGFRPVTIANPPLSSVRLFGYCAV